MSRLPRGDGSALRTNMVRSCFGCLIVLSCQTTQSEARPAPVFPFNLPLLFYFRLRHGVLSVSVCLSVSCTEDWTLIHWAFLFYFCLKAAILFVWADFSLFNSHLHLTDSETAGNRSTGRLLCVCLEKTEIETQRHFTFKTSKTCAVTRLQSSESFILSFLTADEKMETVFDQCSTVIQSRSTRAAGSGGCAGTGFWITTPCPSITSGEACPGTSTPRTKGTTAGSSSLKVRVGIVVFRSRNRWSVYGNNKV